MPTARWFLILVFVVITSPVVASTFIVNDLGDTPDAMPGNDLCETTGNVCTLRAAIEEANAHAGSDSIRFSVAGTITPLLPLLVSDAVDLDATTAPGYSSTPTLVLSGLTASIQFGPGSSDSVIAGIKIEGSAAFGALTIASSNVTVRRNHIGPIGGGTPNLHGIRLESTSALCMIGGNAVADRNVISGNITGIVVAGNGHTIAGNCIGTDATGSSAIPNGTGILIGTAAGTIIGETPDGMNVISGNAAEGILAEGAINLRISYNRIGTNGAGTIGVGNGQSGIHTIGGSNHQIFLNLISGNEQWGVLLETSGTHLSGNTIGRDATNSGALPNVLGGVHLTDSNNNVAGNVIASNTGPGISVASSASLNYFALNSIFENAGLGIDLLDDAGSTPNDALDADAGGNGLQNFPVITNVVTAATASAIAGTLNSTPSSGFTLYFYSSNAADPSGHGEGRTHIGSRNVFTDAAGGTYFHWIAPALTPGHVITATASGPEGTSEFSQARAAVTGPALFFSPVIYAIQESAGSVTLTIRREGDLTGTSAVHYFPGSGSAHAGSDFVLSDDWLTFGPGVAEQTITVPIVVDAIAEPRETFTVMLDNPTAAAITAYEATIVIDPQADLSVTKSVSTNSAPDLTFVVGVQNRGPDAATNVTMTDVLPAGTTLISATPSTGSCSGTTTVVCTFGTLAANTGASVQIVTSWNGQPVTNTATANASETDPNPANNSDSADASAPVAAGIPTASAWGLLALMSILTLIAIARMRT